MAAPTPPSADADDGSTHERNYYRFANKLSAAAIVVACVAAGFTLWQALLVGESNELTRKNNVVSQRAFVSLSAVGQYVSIKPDKTPAALNIVVQLNNSGNTPTKDLNFLIRCVPAGEDMKEPWLLLRQGPPPEWGTATTFIGAHSSEQTGCSFPFDKILQMRDEKLFGYILAEITYFDRLDPGVIHKTQRAMRLRQLFVNVTADPPVIGDIMTAVGAHNCADEECPKD